MDIKKDFVSKTEFYNLCVNGGCCLSIIYHKLTYNHNYRMHLTTLGISA